MSTAKIAGTDKFAFWREKLRAWQQFSRLNIILPPSPAFYASLEYADLENLRLCKMKISGLTADRPQPRAWEHYNHALHVIFQVKGHAEFEQHGRKVLLSPGEWSISDTRFASRMSFASDGVEQLLLMVPEAQFQGIPIHDDFTARTFSSEKGMGRLLYEFLNSSFAELPNLSQQSERNVVATIRQLLACSLLDLLGDHPSTSFREALYLRARAYIIQNVRDPGLNVAQIASALHCSKRYLHMVFANKGITVDESIWRLRLEGCKSDLQNPALVNRSLTEIAFSWGFNNYPHFSRKFRDEFDVSPRSVRAGIARSA